ncbi:MAG: hypothetical protein O2912_10085 [Proteobacteria bacterium]|nr:hypothetical protein [Pseudomonadota bacterium]
MSKIAEKPMKPSEATVSQTESTDPEYLDWVSKKIAQGQRDLKSPDKRTNEKQVWKELGVED